MFVAFLKRAPFVRLILPFSVGIVLQSYMPLLPVVLWGTCCLSGIILLALSRLALWVQFTYGWIKGVVIHLLVIAVGCLVMSYADIRHSGHYFASFLRSSDLLLVTVQEPLQEKPRSYKTVVRVDGIVRGDSLLPAKGNLLVYLEKEGVALECGNQLLLCNKLREIQSSGNPDGFDYRQYCVAQQIYQQVYLREGEWKLVLNNRTGRVRDYCLRILKQYIGEPEAGLAAALLIGYRYDLDKAMVQDYTNTGIVHIIAISGMHLALIYGSLLWLLQWLPSKILKAGIILFFLWAFTWLTGASASVLRATVMFSFITAGRFVLDRHTNIYNTLMASAFLLLCYNPYLLTDVGFQLSYLAVLSILICYRPIYQLLFVRNRWLDKIWEAIALTLSAQVFTLPVCLYYFQQFPLYFLPANLLAVPLSTVILYGEILLLIIPVHFTGTILKWLMYYMNTSVAWIGHLPGALITEIHITLYGTFCCYGIIAGLLAWWLCQWPRGLILALLSCLLWAAWDMADNLQAQWQRKLIVYNIPAHTAVDVIYGRSVQFLGDKTDAIRDKLVSSCLQTARASFKITRSCQYSSGYISLGDKRLLVIDSSQRYLPVSAEGKKLQTDYLLLSHNPHVDIKQLDSLYGIGMLIFDASNTSKNIRKWKSDCYALTLRFFSVPDQGAYVVNF
ncbi:competence protein ComEC [Chitinophaga sp. YR573]|uniref:ComEC/Rec2 family competence protein n=1 Tax=Chitinophaga sp. YR573 TaxID=1881040 RepID=UPI0008B333B7|nr:ComEC/Rec2 family competence protein [Chitinophaga sp. YR573]SEW12892.1 competence protein ComEC [Chitinophaga sp. YR573]